MIRKNFWDQTARIRAEGTITPFSMSKMESKMAAYQRGDVSIATSVLELPSGRYQGLVTLESTAGSIRSFHCPTYRNDPLEARSDADAEVERAYRRYLVEAMPHDSTAVKFPA